MFFSRRKEREKMNGDAIYFSGTNITGIRRLFLRMFSIFLHQQPAHKKITNKFQSPELVAALNKRTGLLLGKIPRYHFLQPLGRTPAPGSLIKEPSRFSLKGTLGSVPGTNLPSKKWKISDKENLPYFRIWKSLT